MIEDHHSAMVDPMMELAAKEYLATTELLERGPTARQALSPLDSQPSTLSMSSSGT